MYQQNLKVGILVGASHKLLRHAHSSVRGRGRRGEGTERETRRGLGGVNLIRSRLNASKIECQVALRRRCIASSAGIIKDVNQTRPSAQAKFA